MLDIFFNIPMLNKCYEYTVDKQNGGGAEWVELFITLTKGMGEPSLASQTHFRKRGKGPVNCVYKPCPAALYSAVQSRCSILSHDTLHHCLSSNSSLENSEREQGHLSRYYSNRKNTENSFQGACLLCNRYFKSAKSGYVI